MTDKGGTRVSEHAGAKIDAGTVQSTSDATQKITAGDELTVTGMGAIRDTEGTYEGKGFAYIDEHDFEHTVTNFQTARQYSSDGNVYVYDGKFTGGYAVTNEGVRARIGLPGSKEYGNTLKKGEVSPIAPGILTSLSGQPPEGMIGVLSNGQEIFLPMSQVQQSQEQKIGQTSTIQGLTLTGEEKTSDLAPGIAQLLSSGELTSDTLQERIQERVSTQETIGQMLRESFGERREQIKQSIKSQLASAIEAQRATGIGLEEQIKEERSQSDIESHKSLKRLREASAARGGITGEERVAETRLLQEALRESGRITGKATEYKQAIASNIAQLKTAAESKEADLMFQMEAEETKALIDQMEKIDQISVEERKNYLAEIQVATNIQSALLSQESVRISNEAGKIANEISKFKLENLPAEYAANLKKIEADIKDMEERRKTQKTEYTALDAAKLAKANLDIKKAAIGVTVAELDLEERQVGEGSIQIFFGAIENGANVADLRSWLSTNRGTLEKLGLYDNFLNVISDMEKNKIYLYLQ